MQAARGRGREDALDEAPGELRARASGDSDDQLGAGHGGASLTSAPALRPADKRFLHPARVLSRGKALTLKARLRAIAATARQETLRAAPPAPSGARRANALPLSGCAARAARGTPFAFSTRAKQL